MEEEEGAQNLTNHRTDNLELVFSSAPVQEFHEAQLGLHHKGHLALQSLEFSC